MRYFIAHKGAKRIANSLVKLHSEELKMGLNKQETYLKLRRNIESSRDQLTALLNKIKRQDKRVVGYAATSKSTTVLNYCGITPDLVEFISDTTPVKQGKYSPGVHIPIRPYEEFSKSYPDYALLFAWNHIEEIFAKENKFVDAGGKWIVYVPEIKVIE